MSLVSRTSWEQKKKFEEVANKTTLDSIGQELNSEDKHNSDNLKRKKRRREHVASSGEKDSKVEQEKEMKRLESFLFGTIYSPLDFGKEASEYREEEGLAEPLFIVNKSTNNEIESYVEELNEEREPLSDDGEDREEMDGAQPAPPMKMLTGNQIVVHEEELNKEKKPAWIDEEESMTKVDIMKVPRLRKLRKEAGEGLISGTDYVSRLRAQHSRLNPGTEWAHIDRKSERVRDSDNESDDESGITVAPGYERIVSDDILRSNDELVVKDRVKLLPGLLEYSRLMDANGEEPSNGPINSIQFHRNGQLLLTAGLDRRLRFFQVDGKRNTKVQSIFIEDCPIHKASFLPDGSQVILSGRRKFFYSVDLVKASVDKIGPLTGREEKSLEVFEVSNDSSIIAFIGNEGYILLVSTRTKELIGTLKMNGSARSLAFADGGQRLLSSGGDGHVYHWDLRTRTCIHKAVDEGCLSGSSLCTSPDSSLFAAGSTSGIVNIYKEDEFLGGKRKPLKTIESLSTQIDCLKFNPDAQILALCSRMKKNSLRLVHVPSFNIFSNWPPPRSSLQYPRCLDFSPGGGFMAVGNASGKVLLYKLHHYQKA
ncbi:U3 small nucleolar RNA-associated protein 18 [Dioscorea alata]|uniref:U3 small nucleolar RNA-associated protein 18 n=4 Tax=Dioscorea alata TaxID=55571 RepID=A0ACB7VI44_DIOAL|nr:U3 small nucleolar RNA-associated protein 18 [Dioscorea alata]KAH7673691.1 U3 small nucleolar RNA-associated protein 18 [Dioscorea alata]KAH7673692.1 U3 small nucleolar RNA-associated protein 18 [Dioscorea alata]KAH7673693.1 U3 small nucleolar RNA-associated protein 18 [Dioscorea alata]